MNTINLKRTFGLVATYGDAVPAYFYAHLFLHNGPELREMFPVYMADQSDRLVHALLTAVSNVDNLAVAAPFLQGLGADHRKFGVEADSPYYDAVGASLLATLQRFLGGEWTADTRKDWIDAYGLVADQMREGAANAAKHLPPFWDAYVLTHERRPHGVAVLTAQPHQGLPFLPGQFVTVTTRYQPRVWRHYSLASAPRLDNTVEFHVRLLPGGPVSTALVSQVRPGDIIRMGPPTGAGLVLPQELRRPQLLLGSGTGVAPLKAVVEALAENAAAGRRRTPPTVLVAGTRDERGHYDMPALAALRTEHRDWLKVITNDPGQEPVDAALTELQDLDGWDISVCGSPAMTDYTLDRLTELGIPAGNIRTEDRSPNPRTYTPSTQPPVSPERPQTLDADTPEEVTAR